jgi:type IV pilus assembly protein PilA
MKLTQTQRGFTLIELMIVVAIVGILASIALPMYQDMVKRSKTSEAAAALGACKTSYADYVAARNELPANENAAGCSVIATQYGNGLTVTNDVIEITLAQIGDPTVDGQQIGFRACQGADPNACTSITATATSIGSFRGYSTVAASSMKLLPATFRNAR